MRRNSRAIDIALDTKSPEQPSGNLVVVPVISTESIVASRGLALHIEKLFYAVHKYSNQDKALEKVFEFLSNDAEAFLRRSRNLQEATDPERHSSHSRAYTAAGIAYLLRGQHSHKTGVWLKNKAGEDQLKSYFNELNKTDDFTFNEFVEWGYKQSIKNEIYWKRQLEAIRTTHHINLLREAIEESDHQPIEV